MSTPVISVRPATEVDADRDGHRFEWLKPDGWRKGFRALVLEIEDQGTRGPLVIGVGRIGPNTVHPTRDLVEIEIDAEHRRRGFGTALIRELGRYSSNPLSTKVAPGSERDLFVRSLGATTYLPVPLLRIDVAAERTGRWCSAVRSAVEGDAVSVHRWRELPRDQLVGALTDLYFWQHASWSPTSSREVIRPEVGEEFYEETAREHSVAVLRSGRITALAELYDEPIGQHREGAFEAVDAAALHARSDAALCLAAMLEELRALGVETADFDNHPTDPHAAPLLATLDRQEADPVHLVEIPNGLTAALRELE